MHSSVENLFLIQSHPFKKFFRPRGVYKIKPTYENKYLTQKWDGKGKNEGIIAEKNLLLLLLLIVL
jgi:hypothetical protein